MRFLRKPSWVRAKAPGSAAYAETRAIVKENNLVTVCEEAACPNIGECWEQKHATFMIMGETCACLRFCNVHLRRAVAARCVEPAYVAEAVAKLGLRHVVITSVDRDDLDDGGAQRFADTINAIRDMSPGTTVKF